MNTIDKSRPSNGGVTVSSNAAELRKQLLRGGWTPLANLDKRCLLEKWTTLQVDEVLIDRWSRRHSKFQATGLRVQDELAVIDVDVNHPMAAKLLKVLEARWPDLLDALVRRGKGDKVAVFCRTTESFSRLHSFRFWAPGQNNPITDTAHCVEIFGGGAPRQFGAFGAHTRADNGDVLVEYRWEDDLSPLDVRLDELPEFTKHDFVTMVELWEKLARDHGFEQVTRSTSGESEASRVYDLVDGMEFECNDGVTRSLAELRHVAGQEGLRCSAAPWLEEGQGHSLTRCLVGRSHSGQLTVWDSASGNTHLPADADPGDDARRQLDTEAVARRLSRLAEAGADDLPELRRRAQLEPSDDYEAALEKALGAYAFCASNGALTVVPIWATSPDEGMSRATFRDMFDPHSKVEVSQTTGKKTRFNPADAWRMSAARINVAGLRMRPDMPSPLYTDDDGRWINTFAKPQHGASPEGQEVFTEFMEHLLPDPEERDYCLDALAHKLAHPDVPGPGLLMVSPRQGAGRGTLFAMLQQLYGSRYVRKVDPGALTGDGEGQGKYNTWLASSSVVLVDELLNPGDGNVFWRRKRAYDRIKSLIDPATREVEIIRKTLPNYAARTFTTFIMATNNANALPLDEDDRRICVLNNGRKLADNPELAEKLNRHRRGGEFTEGFVAGVARALEARPLDKFDAYAPPPFFAGKITMIARNMTEIAEAADAVLDELPGDYITRDAFLERVRRKLHETEGGAYSAANHKNLAAEARERIDRAWVSIGRVKINEKENKAEVWARDDAAARRWKGVSWAERAGSLAINGDPLRTLSEPQHRALARGFTVLGGGKAE